MASLSMYTLSMSNAVIDLYRRDETYMPAINCLG